MGHAAIMNAALAVGSALICLVLGRIWGRSNVKSQLEDALENARKSYDAREYSLREQLEEKMAEIARLQPLAEEAGRLRQQLPREKQPYDETAGSEAAAIDASSESEPLSAREPAPPPESADIAIQKLLRSLESTLTEPDQQPASITEPHQPPTPSITPEQQKPLSVQPVIEPLPAATEPRPLADPRQPVISRTPVPAPVPIPQSVPAVAPYPVAAAQRSGTPLSTPEVRPATPVPAVQAPVPVAGPRPAVPSRPTTTPGQSAPPVSAAASKPAPLPRPAAASQPAAKPNPGAPQAVDEWQEFARSLAALTERKQ